jgi:hypothetical protein
MKMIGVAAAAAIAFAPFAVLPVVQAPPAHAGPCQDAYRAALQSGVEASVANNAYFQCVTGRAPGNVGTSPDCQQYTLPTDRGRCEDQHAAGQR